MTSAKRFCYNYPILTACIVPILYLLVVRQCIMSIAIRIFSSYTGRPYSSFASLAVGEGVTILVDLMVLMLCGNIRILIQRGISRNKKVLYSSYIIFEILVLFAINVHQIIYYKDSARSPLTILGCVIYLLLASISEEVMFRGFLVEILASKYLNRRGGIWIVTIVSSIAFASIHLWNLFIPGASVGGILAQTVNAMLIGAYFTVIFLWTMSIWVSVILHFAYNFSQLLRSVCFVGKDVSEVISNYGTTFHSLFFLVHMFVFIIVICIMIIMMRHQKHMPRKCSELE